MYRDFKAKLAPRRTIKSSSVLQNAYYTCIYRLKFLKEKTLHRRMGHVKRVSEYTIHTTVDAIHACQCTYRPCEIFFSFFIFIVLSDFNSWNVALHNSSIINECGVYRKNELELSSSLNESKISTKIQAYHEYTY